MISLYNASILDGLPAIIKEQVWAQAMSKAVQKEIRKILDYAKIAPLYAAIDMQKEQVLDLMAIDLKVHEYSQKFEITKKRSLIKESLARWSKAGTKYAVEELCTKIFGDSHITEWYEYEGRPHYFKVTCTNSQVTEKDIDAFKKAVESIKRLSAWLDGVELILHVETMPLYTAFSLYVTTKENFALKYSPAMYCPKPMTDTTAFSIYKVEKANLGVLDCTIIK